MVNYDSVREMLNVTENMQHLVNNAGHDDDTMTFEGVDWFPFNGMPASQIFVSGNSFIGLGANAEHLLVCRRDAKMWHFYREEATLFGIYRVLKIRWEGYAQYNSAAESVALQYEWLFIETGDMFLNIIKAPESSGYLGSSRINSGMHQSFTVETSRQQYISFYHLDDMGEQFSIDYNIIEIEPPFERRYLMEDGDGIMYRVEHEKAFVDSIGFTGCQLIRTGIVPDQDTRVKVRFQTSQFGDYALFGCRKSTSEAKFGVFLTSSTQISGQFGTESVTEEADEYSRIDVEIELAADGLKRDGVVIAEFAECGFISPCELTVGTYNTDGRLDSHFFRGWIYGIEVWQGEEKMLDLIPCIDEKVRVCFYDRVRGGCFYNEGTGSFGYADSQQEAERCTRLIEVETGEINADLFRRQGFENFPQSEVFTRLVNPKLYYWQDSDAVLPIIRAEVLAVPPAQIVYSKNTQMTDSTILGVEKVEIESDDTTLFAFSFDGGETWKAYIDNAWVVLSEDASGINRESVEAIGTDGWAVAKETNQYMIRFTLLEGGYVNRIIVHYLN